MTRSAALRLDVWIWLCALLALPAAGAGAQPASADSAALARIISVQVRDMPLAEALTRVAAAAKVSLSFSRDMLPEGRRVSAGFERIRLDSALATVLGGTSLRASVVAGHLVILPARNADAPVGTIAIRGHVVDAATGAALSGALVELHGSPAPVRTGSSGEFAFPAAPADASHLAVRLVGYSPAVREIPDGSDAQAIEIALTAVPFALDRIVVMGSAAGAPARGLTSALSVIEGSRLDELHVLRLDDLFHGSIPGVLAWTPASGSAVTRFGSIRGSSSFSVNYLKTYVDGVEVASPLFIAAIDPNSVERIEVIRGPQGAALYGSDAISGVLQIMTKRGSASADDRSSLTARSSAGLVASEYAPGSDFTQDHTIAARARVGSVAVNGGASFRDIGEFLPGGGSTATSAFGSARTNRGTLTFDASARVAKQSAGTPYNPLLREMGMRFPVVAARDQHVLQQAASFSLDWVPGVRVSHRVVLGVDRNESDIIPDRLPIVSSSDSAIRLARGTTQRSSVRYSGQLDMVATDALEARMTVGADAGVLEHRSLEAGGALPPGSAGSTISGTGRQFNLGQFAQLDAGLRERIFITAGIRAERNAAFGPEYGVAWLPMTGAALVHESGDLSLKLRASHGKGIRPPNPAARLETVTAQFLQVANPELGPESQSGIEAGVDLAIAGRLHVQLTRYSQTAAGLVQPVLVSAPGELPREVQQQNIGEIDNRGWELEAGLRYPWLVASGSWVVTSSRVRRLSRNYRGDLRVGDHMLEVPESVGSMSATLIAGGNRLGGTVSRVGEWINHDWLALYRTAMRLEPRRSSVRDYWIVYPAFTRIDMSLSRAVTPRMAAFVRVGNLLGDQRGERDNLHIGPGRTVTLGVSLGETGGR